jgi:hypothetical protein
MLQKNAFNWMRQQHNDYMKTQIIAAAATLCAERELTFWASAPAF